MKQRQREHEVILNRGIELISNTTDLLNGIIKTTGHIDINNREIWKRTLNRWCNEDWLCIVAVLIELDANTNYLKPNHQRALLAVETVLKTEWNTHHRILDTKPHKSKAWQLMHTAREVWNAINGQYIPNGELVKWN